jgi:hypothetical protein
MPVVINYMRILANTFSNTPFRCCYNYADVNLLVLVIKTNPYTSL